MNIPTYEPDENPLNDATAEVYAFLDNYVDGRTLFKDARDWDHPVKIRDGVEKTGLPDTWLGVVTKTFSIIAKKELGLDVRDNRIDIIDPEQMLDYYASIGLPDMYPHWSFAKRRRYDAEGYRKGKRGLAYELVINSDPTINYCMASNSPLMMMLVIAHAAFGHNHFFKNNTYFEQYTRAGTILEDIARMKSRMLEYNQRYGERKVTQVLDACHALMDNGVSRGLVSKKLTPDEIKARDERIAEARRLANDPMIDRFLLPSAFQDAAQSEADRVKKQVSQLVPIGEENILSFLADYAPHAEEWQRDLLRMTVQLATYFYPQRLTKMMNEGCATFVHYQMIHRLEDMGLMSSGQMLEFYASHSGVIYQPPYDSKHFSGFNPYTLGFAICMDIKRMCLKPTEEDKRHFPHIAGKRDYMAVLRDMWEGFRDETCIQQYLSPKVIRDFRMFAVSDKHEDDFMRVSGIHDDVGYHEVRERLAAQYCVELAQRDITVADFHIFGDRALVLRDQQHRGRPINEDQAREVMKYVYQIWQYPVFLQCVDGDGKVVKTIQVPPDYKYRPQRRYGMGAVTP